MIRKSTFDLGFANTGKSRELLRILEEGRRVINVFIGVLWAQKKFTGKFFNAKTETWLSARLQQACGKQAPERSGVRIEEVNPAFTSQTCSRCGCKDKANRSGEVFACTSCGWVGDADLNASVNISRKFRLREDMDPEKPVSSFGRDGL